MTLRNQKNHYNVKFLKGYGCAVSLKNNEVTLKINQELIALLLKMQKGEKTNEEDLEQIQKNQAEINKLVEKRTIFSKEDLDFLKKLQEDN